jgi:hypothetical protein
MTGDIRGTRRPRSTGGSAAVALAIIITALAACALLGGPMLDDHWTIYLSDMSRGLGRLADDRWIQDIRPPRFDGWATLLAMAGIDSIPLGRLVSALPAVAILIFAVRCFSKRLPGQRAFYTIFLLLMLSTPATARAGGGSGGSPGTSCSPNATIAARSTRTWR